MHPGLQIFGPLLGNGVVPNAAHVIIRFEGQDENTSLGLVHVTAAARET